MRHCLAAFTAATGVGYPPYVSINREESGDVSVTVREGPILAHGVVAAEGRTACATVPAAEFDRMARDLAPIGEPQIKHMVERFLSMPLPEGFNPDGGIKFDPVINKGTAYEHRYQPSGTNLFGYDQAEAMVRHMLEGLPA